jgi:hypothetical protein
LEGSFNSEGGGPYDGGMEARVARLEAGLSDIKATLARLEPVLSQVSKDLVDIRTKDLVELKVAAAKLEGRVSQLPSTIQLLGFVLAVPTIAGVTRFITGP